MHAAIADKKEELVELCLRHGVIRLEVFGSAARGTDFDPQTSDADFLVEFRPENGRTSLRQYFDFAEALRHTLGRPVDLIESGAVRNPYLRAAIDRSRELVYAS
ncbi:MAG: nucleotidyltransferase domain-containing protein [Rhodospirillaceae bacterium]|nr:nucleotidyltransferase domain-containing protein [Rhodospirillaceae bacterium]